MKYQDKLRLCVGRELVKTEQSMVGVHFEILATLALESEEPIIKCSCGRRLEDFRNVCDVTHPATTWEILMQSTPPVISTSAPS
jgi:hypothetical protein